MNKYMTINEAAGFLRVAPRTLRRYLASGRIPYTKPVGRVLINEKDLIDFVNIVR